MLTAAVKRIFRQAKRSLIVENAHNIVSGRPLQKGGKEDDFFFLEADGEVCQKLVCDLVTTRLPRSYGFDPVRDIQVLCPTKMGPCGTQALNSLLQDMLNPPAPGKPQLQSASRVFRVGDKVMQVRNNYEIIWHRDGGEQGVGRKYSVLSEFTFLLTIISEYYKIILQLRKRSVENVVRRFKTKN